MICECNNCIPPKRVVLCTVEDCACKLSDEVEAKIQEIWAYHGDGHVLKETASLGQRLRELVALARQVKR